MPEIFDVADGSQDALIVKVEAGGLTGWGECEASPLTSIANYVVQNHTQLQIQLKDQ